MMTEEQMRDASITMADELMEQCKAKGFSPAETAIVVTDAAGFIAGAMVSPESAKEGAAALSASFKMSMLESVEAQREHNEKTKAAK